MSNQDLINSAKGYFAGQAIANSVASSLAAENQKTREKLEEWKKFYSHYLTQEELADKIGNFILSGKQDLAFEFLNESLKGEIIHDCQNQKEFTSHLTDLIDLRKNKYRPFYAKIGKEMPSMIEGITAQEICSIMSIELMSPEELKEYHRAKDEKEESEKFAENVGLVFRAILIIGLIILMIVLSAQ